LRRTLSRCYLTDRPVGYTSEVLGASNNALKWLALHIGTNEERC